MKTIIVPDDILLKIKNFATEVATTTFNKHKNRGATDLNKSILDHFNGTLAEYVVYFTLKEKGFDCSEPDIVIYGGMSKSFKSDLFVKTSPDTGFDLHVKSVTKLQASKTGISWLFQKEDPLLKPPFNGQIITFVMIENEKSGKILKMVAAKDIFPVKLKEPLYERFKHSKYAIYFNDL